MEQQWYVAYTKPHCEKKVSELLTKKKVLNYCPFFKSRRNPAGFRKIIPEPVFPSYVFIRIRKDELSYVRSFDSIVNLVYWLGDPVVVRDTEIDTIRKFLDEYIEVTVEKAAITRNGEVRTSYGQLMYMEGQGPDGLHRKVRVVLPSLGYALVATAFSLQKLTMD